ncbi:MAG: hypothetical protein JOS17DRAFT_726628, partial [Linnemannia elongata]
MSASLKHEFHQIPELVRSLHPFLSHADLVACTRICRLWHDIFIPQLWRAIDDRDYAWTRILMDHDSADENNGKDIIWLRAIFKKYGRHIFHLRTTWSVVINAASEGGTCTNLQSLRIHDISETRTNEEEDEEDLVREYRRKKERRQRAVDQPLLSPIFENILKPWEAGWRSERRQQLDWITAQRIWLLIQQNSGTLQTLYFSRPLPLCGISTEFVYDVLSTLRNLVELGDDSYYLDLGMLLGRLPNLTSFTRRLTSAELVQTRCTQLRELDTCNELSNKEFFELLKNLPNLESLRFAKFNDEDEVFCPRSHVIKDNSTHRLKRLSIYDDYLDDGAATEVLSYSPQLTHLELGEVLQETVTAIVTYCRDLQTFREHPPLLSGLSKWIEPPTNKLLPLVRTCGNLRILDAGCHRFDIDDLVAEPWASQDLETINCLLAGLMYLTDFETKIVEGERGICSQREVDRILDKHRAIQEQHIKVYDFLASMTRLVTLDIGADHKSTEDLHQRIYEVDGEKYLDYGSPPKDTLQLSLASGLDRLRVLKDLEVFGFEGFSHQIGKAELEWMATSWPKLNVMRGLQEDTLHRMMHDSKKAELREYMESLRPDVKHETSVYVEGF